MLGRVALHRRLAVHRPGGIVWSQPWVCFWKITLLLNPRVCFKNHLVSRIAKKNGHGKREHKGEQKFVFLKKNRTAGTKDKPCIVIMLSVTETAGGFLGRAGVVLFGWLPCWKSSSACLPGQAEQAARCPPAVCGFQDLLTMPLSEASPSLDSVLARAMEEKTDGDVAGRGTEGGPEYICVIFQWSLTTLFKNFLHNFKGGKKIKLLCFFLCKAALVKNAPLFCRAVRQYLEYLWSLQKYWVL